MLNCRDNDIFIEISQRAAAVVLTAISLGVLGEAPVSDRGRPPRTRAARQADDARLTLHVYRHSNNVLPL